MASSIRISRKAAQALANDVVWGGPYVEEQLGPDIRRALEELRRALAPRPRKSLPFPSRREAKAAKKKTKRERTAEVYAAVAKRAGGRCECGCGNVLAPASVGGWWRPTLDHFWGKARSETVETCWLIAWIHHEDKTHNRPSRAAWLDRFQVHCWAHGYSKQAAKARAELESDVEIEQAAEISKGLAK